LVSLDTFSLAETTKPAEEAGYVNVLSERTCGSYFGAGEDDPAAIARSVAFLTRSSRASRSSAWTYQEGGGRQSRSASCEAKAWLRRSGGGWLRANGVGAAGAQSAVSDQVHDRHQ